MDVLPVGKNANPLWKAAIWLAAAAAVASFMISAKPTREFGDWHVLSGVVAVLLNPLCWIGLWGWMSRANCVQCPHCGNWADRQFFTRPPKPYPGVGDSVKCFRCKQMFAWPSA
jgi:hypothetical protein